MKKVKQIAIVIAVIFIALIVYGMVSKISGDNQVQELQSAPVSTLKPTGELAEVFGFGTDFTDIQRENKLKEIKGSVVAWQLPVYEVKRDGEHYRVQTQNPKTFGQNEAIVPTIISITPLSAEDKSLIEAMKTGDIISIKGRIADVKLRHIIINPAFLYTAPAQSSAAQPEAAKEQAVEENITDAAQSDVNASLAEATEPMDESEGTNANLKPSFDCAKAATAVEKIICSDALIGKLDGALASNYKTMIAANIGDGALTELKSKQKEWMASRNNCADNQCLINAYKARIDEVCEYPVLSGIHPECLMSDDIH